MTPTVNVYLEEATYSRLVRTAESHADVYGTGAKLAGIVLRNVLGNDAKGRSLRRALDLPEA